MSDRTTQTRTEGAHKAGHGNNIFRLDEMAGVDAGARHRLRRLSGLSPQSEAYSLYADCYDFMKL